MNLAQALLKAMKIPYISEKGKSRSYTKKGPGRLHKQGK